MNSSTYLAQKKKGNIMDNETLKTQLSATQTYSGEFAEYIFADLIAQGFSGDELLKQFKAKQAQIRPAVEAMIAEAEAAAHGKGEYAKYEDIFENAE